MMMPAMRLRLLLALLWLPAAVSLAEEKIPQRPVALPEYSYCMAYVLNDADGNVLLQSGDELLDVKALAARKTKEARLTPEQAKGVIVAASADVPRLPPMECYEPHHVFVFYSKAEKPVACLEVCFTCNAAKLRPSADPENATLYRYDQNALAKMVGELKLPLTPYTSLEDYEKNKQRQKQDLERTMKELQEGKRPTPSGSPLDAETP
jgi:hypothetical protein